MIARNALVTTLALAVSLAATGSAKAACNSVPVASEVTNGTVHVAAEVQSSGGNPLPLPSGFEGAFRYKGALGRVDGAFFAPGLSEQLRFAADDLCVGGPTKEGPAGAPIITPIGPIDDLAIFVAYDAAPGFAVPVWPYVKTSRPPFSVGELARAMAELPPLHKVRDRKPVHFTLGDRWDPRVERVRIAHGVDGVGITTPDLTGEGPAPIARPALWHLESSGVRILAVRIGEKTPQQLAADLDSFLRNECSAICQALRPKDVVLCIDKIYTRPVVPDFDQLMSYTQDPFVCSVSISNDSQYRDFADGCEEPVKVIAAQPIPQPKPTPTPTPAPAKDISVLTPVLHGCDEPVSGLRIYRGDCGAMQIPLSYANIRKRVRRDGVFVAWVNRRLSGLSGVGRGTNADGKRIYVPGREFLGSTPRYDGGASRPDTSWRRPNLDVWYPDGQEGAELGLTGVADKNESIVHVFPRLPAYLICESSLVTTVRGCMKADSTGIHCACEDTGPSGCLCTPLWGDGRYFACAGGDRTNMPCTRDDHCKSRDTARESGVCSRKPICRPDNTVWRRMPNNDDPDPAGAIECQTDGDCAESEQCGYSLFDFASRVAKSPGGWYDLDRTVVVPALTVDHVRRGACAHDRELACSNAAISGTPEACPATNRCRGFSLVAGGEN